ncbi:MAG: lysylphosphatidylglycerol synthase transmembrane domain-containing protein [Candidatus Saccharimonadales bacterium]
MAKVPLKTWISVLTFLLVAVIVYASRHELLRAWDLLGQVNLWILLLLLPAQAISYYAAGAMVFSYLKEKFDLTVPRAESARIALELNFVNHILPSAGVSGASYMTWRLGELGISPARATLAQVVRFAATFGAYLVLMLIAVVAITLDVGLERIPILVSSGLASAIIFGSLLTVYIIQSPPRLHKAAVFITKHVNRFWRGVLRRTKPLLYIDDVNKYFEDLHDDYSQIVKAPRILRKPFLWGLVFVISEIALFWITFWALGTIINPAPLLIAYGLAGFASAFFFTPGGVGGYEALMVGFLATTGIDKGAVIAAVLLARVILIIITIVTGYYFYQRAINRYGNNPT